MQPGVSRSWSASAAPWNVLRMAQRRLRRRNALALVTKAYVWMRYKHGIEQVKKGITPLTGSMLPSFTDRREPKRGYRPTWTPWTSWV